MDMKQPHAQKGNDYSKFYHKCNTHAIASWWAKPRLCDFHQQLSIICRRIQESKLQMARKKI